MLAALPLPAPSTPPVPARAPRGASLAMSADGRWLAVASGDALWLEDSRTGVTGRLALAPGHDVAIAGERVWVARDNAVESIPCAGGPAQRLAIAPGAYRLCAAGSALAIAGVRGTTVVRGDRVAELGAAAFVRSIGESRLLTIDGPERAIVDVTGEPRAVRLGVGAHILDACPILDPSTMLLLVERGGDQELVVMRTNGGVLARVRVRGVHRIAGAARAYRVALATGDGRVIVYDLRERAVVSADRVAESACEIVLDPDGARLSGLAWSGRTPRLFERRLTGREGSTTTAA